MVLGYLKAPPNTEPLVARNAASNIEHFSLFAYMIFTKSIKLILKTFFISILCYTKKKLNSNTKGGYLQRGCFSNSSGG